MKLIKKVTEMGKQIKNGFSENEIQLNRMEEDFKGLQNALKEVEGEYELEIILCEMYLGLFSNYCAFTSN